MVLDCPCPGTWCWVPSTRLVLWSGFPLRRVRSWGGVLVLRRDVWMGGPIRPDVFCLPPFFFCFHFSCLVPGVRIGPAPHRVSRALRARNPGRVRKESRKSPPGAGPPESRKSAPQSLKRVRKELESQVSDSFRTLLRLRGALFRDSGGPAPGGSFGTLFGLFRGSGPEGPERPCAGRGRS